MLTKNLAKVEVKVEYIELPVAKFRSKTDRVIEVKYRIRSIIIRIACYPCWSSYLEGRQFYLITLK